MKFRNILKFRDRILIIFLIVILGTVAVKAIDNRISKINLDENNNNLPCPDDMVFVQFGEKGVCLDRYEASAGSECLYLNPDNQGETRVNLDYSNCRPVSEKDNLPWRFISQDQAEIACSKAGKKLASNEEWLAGALGTADKENGWGIDDCQVAGNWPSQPGPSGAGKNCVSSAGAYDMIGNVWEWTKETVSDGRIGEKNLPDSGYVNSTDGNAFPATTNTATPNPNYNEDYFWIKKTGARSIARGGYWDNKSDAGAYAMYSVLPASDIGPGIGFRCAKIIY